MSKENYHSNEQEVQKDLQQRMNNGDVRVVINNHVSKLDKRSAIGIPALGASWKPMFPSISR